MFVQLLIHSSPAHYNACRKQGLARMACGKRLIKGSQWRHERSCSSCVGARAASSADKGGEESRAEGQKKGQHDAEEAVQEVESQVIIHDQQFEMAMEHVEGADDIGPGVHVMELDYNEIL